jgi:hypothetical protein
MIVWHILTGFCGPDLDVKVQLISECGQPMGGAEENLKLDRNVQPDRYRITGCGADGGALLS